MMAWPVTDFSYVDVNDGTGYAEIEAIHLAIKERADATAHSLASGDYSAVWDDTQLVWLSWSAPDNGYLTLIEVLRKFYDDIVLLIGGDDNIRWTDLPETGSAELDINTLKADIGLGDFEDLLTGPFNHFPFLWLHECLDRLIYARVRVQPTDNAGNYDRNYSDLQNTSQLAWDDRNSNYALGTAGFPVQLSWGDQAGAVSGFPLARHRVEIRDGYTSIEFITDIYSGELQDAAYTYSLFFDEPYWTAGSWSVLVGSNTISGSESAIDQSAATTDFTIEEKTYIDASVLTPEPSLTPVSFIHPPFGATPYRGARFILYGVDLFLNLTEELEDQA